MKYSELSVTATAIGANAVRAPQAKVHVHIC